MIRSAAALGLMALLAVPAGAVELTVGAVQISEFAGAALDQPVGKLIWRGGIAMVSQDDTFGGLSGLAFTGPDQRVALVSDRGNFVSGKLAYDEDNRLFGFIGVRIEPIQNSKGAPLPRQYARDAESIAAVVVDGAPVAVRVGFEHLTRVAEFELTNGVPGGAAREIDIPKLLTDTRTNETLEAVCIAPPASPVAGATLLLTEGVFDEHGQHVAWLTEHGEDGWLSYQASPDINPTDCAFLPNGDLLVLERGVSFLSFTMALRRVPAADVRAGQLMKGELLLSASGGAIDNMEQVAVHVAPGGETRIVLGSDNNFNDWERSLLLEFALFP